MLKEYKLIKKYPSLPKDWEVGMIVGLGDRPALYSPCHGKYSNKYLSDQEVENQIEFWEEVVEKDYEILSFKATDKFGVRLYANEIVILNSVKGYVWKNINQEGPGCSLEEMLIAVKKGIHIIHSVKRLSDGEVFTIGDKIEFYRDKFIITDLSIQSGWGGQVRVGHKDGGVALSEIKHLPKPLFKTEDGVNIFKGDEYYHTKPNFEISYGGKANGKESGSLIGTKGYYYFSTKEAAKEYILMNKPCLSIVEIAPLIGKANMGQYIDLTLLTKNLKYLVKSKI